MDPAVVKENASVVMIGLSKPRQELAISTRTMHEKVLEVLDKYQSKRRGRQDDSEDEQPRKDLVGPGHNPLTSR